MFCIFCDGQVNKMGKCIVCPNCKTVMLQKGISTSALYDEINNSLNSIQQYLEEINDCCLHAIIQKEMNGEPLTELEQNKKRFAECFQDCRMTLVKFMEDGISIADKTFREYLYVLLELGLEFNSVFDAECYIIEV